MTQDDADPSESASSLPPRLPRHHHHNHDSNDDNITRVRSTDSDSGALVGLPSREPLGNDLREQSAEEILAASLSFHRKEYGGRSVGGSGGGLLSREGSGGGGGGGGGSGGGGLYPSLDMLHDPVFSTGVSDLSPPAAFVCVDPTPNEKASADASVEPSENTQPILVSPQLTRQQDPQPNYEPVAVMASRAVSPQLTRQQDSQPNYEHVAVTASPASGLPEPFIISSSLQPYTMIPSTDNPTNASAVGVAVASASLDYAEESAATQPAVASASLSDYDVLKGEESATANAVGVAVASASLEYADEDDYFDENDTPAVVVSMMGYDDDPAMRKIMEEERLMSQVRMRSVVESTAPQPLSASAAELDSSGPSANAEAIPIPSTTLAHAVSDEYDAKPAAAVPAAGTLPVYDDDHPFWGGRRQEALRQASIEATSLLDDVATGVATAAVIHEIPSSFEDGRIAVTTYSDDNAAVAVAAGYEEILPGTEYGSQSDEGLVVGITEEIHPSDLASSDAQAELMGPADNEGLIVGISEEVHPSDLASSDAQAEYMGSAEFVGADYSQHDVLSPVTGVASASTMMTQIEDPQHVEEVMVLDSKPAAIGNVLEEGEATVIETKAPHQESWTEPQGELEEIAVTGVDEAEAVVTAITEELHPSDFGSNEVSAQATLIGRDFTRSVSVPNQPRRPTDPTPRLSSAPTEAVAIATNPFEDNPNDTPAMSRDGLAELDRQEEAAATWMDDPIDVLGRPLPPPDAMASLVTDQSGAPIAEAAVIGEPVVAPIAPATPTHLEAPSCSGTPPIPSRSSGRRETSRTSTVSSNAESDSSTSRNRSTNSVGSEQRRAGRQIISQAVRGTNQIMTSLFGDAPNQSRRWEGSPENRIRSRELLPFSVFPSESTGMWVATVNTNQKALDNNDIQEASKALRAFSVPTKQQAEALARAWAPPRMLPFSQNNTCYICESRFAVFKRPCHCRNCGVCICNSCAVQWPSKMIPDTYNIKSESVINICQHCDWLCSAFRSALLEGNHDQAVALHATGNINLVTPFANVKGELFYPVHCAVIGGSLVSLKWLVDEHCCPLRSIRISGKTRDSSGSFTPILTSKGRSLLGIAMEKENVDLIRYLVVDKGMPLSGEKEMSMITLVRIMDRLLRLLPSEEESKREEQAASFTRQDVEAAPSSTEPRSVAPAVTTASTSPSRRTSSRRTSSPRNNNSTSNSNDSWGGQQDFSSMGIYDMDNDSTGSIEDPCIICYANSIDSVATPCGHQICCMQCGSNISKCPVCQVDCSFIRFYKP